MKGNSYMNEIYRIVDSRDNKTKYIGKVASRDETRDSKVRFKEHVCKDFWAANMVAKIYKLDSFKHNGKLVVIDEKMGNNEIMFIENHLMSLYNTNEHCNEQFSFTSGQILSNNLNDYNWVEITDEEIKGEVAQFDEYFNRVMRKSDNAKNRNYISQLCNNLLRKVERLINKFPSDTVRLTVKYDENNKVKLNFVENKENKRAEDVKNIVNKKVEELKAKNTLLTGFITYDKIKPHTPFGTYGNIVKIEEKVSTNPKYKYEDKRYCNIRFEANNGNLFTMQLWREDIDKFRPLLNEAKKNPNTKYFVYGQKREDNGYENITVPKGIYRAN
jgi:hypothetical protein